MERILKNNKREKGITLVALVVTIIVLLILAFIAISILMGDNGVVEKAKESKEETIKAQEREFIKLAYQDLEMDYKLKGTYITADRVMEKLSEYDKNIKVEMITKDEIGDTEIVVEKNSGEEYAEIVFTKTEHTYAGSLVIDTNKARYEVTYNANRGSGGPTKQIKIEGTPLTITLEKPERKGYNFIGWAKESTAVVAEYLGGSQYTEDANITLYAVWQLRTDIDPVAQIGSIKYPSIQEAIYACSKEAGEEKTTIILLKNTEEEFTTFEGQNIIIDLQGHIVTSESEGALCTNNGKLQIINGSLSSNKGTSILNNGEITIGDNSTGIDDNTPTIYGNKVGVDNKGTFNYYDGKIQGIVPIQGTTTSTPDQYGPVQTGYENGISTIQLRILTQYEARIGWVYYETLQGAIDISKAKETVTLIKNLQLKEILQVGENKDVILDLYGYELTVASGLNTVIKNYGDLEITDNSAKQTGNIIITSTGTCNGIRNEGEKTLTITGGTISSSSNSSCSGIYNVSIGNIKVKEGTIISNSSYKYGYSSGIYNAGSGIIEIIEIAIYSSNSGNNSNCKCYGIYNANTGDIIIKGGIINSNSYTSCGIYNASVGKINFDGGTINSDSNGAVQSYGIYNNKNGIVFIKNGVINTKGGYNPIGIYNKDTGSIEINGGVINTYDAGQTGYGILNENSGTIKVISGKIIGERGIFNSENGNLIIGTENAQEISQENPYIIGEVKKENSRLFGIGIYNKNGNVEFYNGIVEGNIALLGNIHTIKDGYQIIKETKENTEIIYLISKQESPVVEIEGIKYNDLQSAIDSIEENEEKVIEVLQDFEIDKPIKNNKNIILDLKGKTIINYFYEIENLKNFKILDTIGGGKINSLNTIYGIINKENAVLTIAGGIIHCTSNGMSYGSGGFSSYSYGIYNDKGILELDDGTISSSSNNTYSYGVYNNAGTTTINGGIISSNSYTECSGIFNKDGNIKIIDGTISNSSTNSAWSYGILNSGIGNIIMEGGTINSDYFGIYNTSTELIEIKGGIVNSNNYGSNYAIYNNSTGTIIIKGGTINSINNGNGSNSNYKNCGIYNANSGTVKVENGIINSTSSANKGNNSSYGIYNASNGNIIIGIKGDGTVLEENPYVKASIGISTDSVGYGIYNISGKLYFYDGKLEGTTRAYYDILTEYEDNTELNYNENETILNLTTNITPEAQIGTITYDTLQQAIDAVGSAQTTIQLLKNLIYTNKDMIITISNNKNIILDLNGYKISSAIQERTIENNGILEIIDQSSEQTGIIISNESKTIVNLDKGKLIISGGTIENRNSCGIYNFGDVVVQGGNVKSSINYYIDNDYYNTIVYGIYNVGIGNIVVKKGKIYSYNNDGYSYGIFNEDNGNIQILGGTVNANSTYYAYGIYNAKSGIVQIEGGNIISDNSGGNYHSNSNRYGIYNASNGNIIIEDGIINSISSGSSGNCYGIFNEKDGNIEIIKGEINSNGSSNGDAFGIYNNSVGNIIIGNKDSNIENETIYINGEYTKVSNYHNGYGIYNFNGTLMYYDGIIKGTTKAVYGNIAEIENLTEIIFNEENVDNIVYKIMTLNQITTNVASANGIEYDSIQKAIEACGELENTIELLRDSNLGATIIIGENQNITIDLKGHTINNYTELQNKGTLKIIDTSSEQTGEIVGLTGTVISNTGTLEIQGGTISDSGYGIKNIGTITLNGGEITGNTYGIYNDSKGTVNVERGTISSNTYGIYNYSSSSITNINEGTITSNEYGIYNYNGTTNIASKGITSNTYGVYVANGTVTVKEGAEIQAETGIYVSSGTLNIGETGTMNPDSPIITGETYGLSVAGAGKVYMYDGQVKGKTGATEGYITYTEEGYVVANKTEGEYFVNYLALGGTASAVAQVSGVSYSNLQSAINSITGGEEQTIILLNGIVSTETYTIAEGQNIKLDMNGKTITSEAEETINSNGSLTIIDTSGKNVAKITSTTGTAIINSGTLTLGEDEGTVIEGLITIEGETVGIENTGELNFFDGAVIGTTAINGEVKGTPTGYTITTSTVSGKQKATLTQ